MKPIIAIIITANFISGCGFVPLGPSRAEVVAICSFEDVGFDGDDYIAFATEARRNGLYKDDVLAELVDFCVASVEHAAAIRQEITDSEEIRDACDDCATAAMDHICIGLPPSCSLQHR